MIVNNNRHITPLMCAAFNINYDRIKFLLDCGANPNIIDSSNQSALLYVLTRIKEIPEKCSNCKACNIKINNISNIIIELCEHKQNLNILARYNENSIMIAVRLGFIEAVRIFCDYNFDINHKNIDGKTAMSLAIENNYPLICYYLWKKGADIDTTDKKNRTFLMSLVSNNISITNEIIEEVLQHKPNINIRDDNKADALLYAFVNFSIDTVKLLLKYGADVNYGMIYAIYKSNVDYIDILSSCEQTINYDRLIKYAKQLKNKDIEKLLIKKSRIIKS